MDCKEEQEGEIEALKSIYTEEEFRELSSCSPWSFEILVKAELNELNAQCTLHFELPEDYPETVPVMNITSHSKHVDPKIIETLLNETADESIGVPMIFTLTSAVQDKLMEILEDIQTESDRIQEEEEEEVKRKEEEKYSGTLVTVETFNEWKKAFMEEFKMTKLTQQNQKLTGKQMFERDASLILSDARFLTEGDEDPFDDDGVEVDESLFQDLGDLDIDS